MKRLLTAIVVNTVLFSSMSITAYAASGVVRAFFRTEVVKGIYVEDNADDDALSEDEALKGAEEFIAPEASDDPVTEDMDETTVDDEPEDEHTE